MEDSERLRRKLVVSLVILAAVVAAVNTLRYRPDEFLQPGETTKAEGAAGIHLPIEDAPVPGQPHRAPTFRELVDGNHTGVTDAELLRWIERNNGSEEAWMVAVSSRFYPGDGNSGWLDRALEAHPDSPAFVSLAALVEVIQASSDSGPVSRRWLDCFIRLDPENGMAWFLSAIAEHSRGNPVVAREHWIQAGLRSEVVALEDAFEDATYRHARATGYSEAAATLLGSASSHSLPSHIPRLNKILEAIHEDVETLRDRGHRREADAMAVAGYNLGVRFFEASGPSSGEPVYKLLGIAVNRHFEDEVGLELRLDNADSIARMTDFSENFRILQKRIPSEERITGDEFVSWYAIRRQLGYLDSLKVIW